MNNDPQFFTEAEQQASEPTEREELLLTRITEFETKLEQDQETLAELHKGGYPAWAYPNGTCSCKQSPCICSDPMPEVNVLFAELETQLAEEKNKLREAIASVKNGHFCPSWDGLFVHDSIDAADACHCFDARAGEGDK